MKASTQQAIQNAKLLLRLNPDSQVSTSALLVAYEKLGEAEQEIEDLRCHNKLMRDSLRKGTKTDRTIR